MYWLSPERVVALFEVPSCGSDTSRGTRFEAHTFTLPPPPNGPVQPHAWAQVLNREGVLGRSLEQLIVAVALDPTWALARYNAACVAADHSEDDALDLLAGLAALETPLSKQKLQKTLVDEDFRLLWKSPSFVKGMDALGVRREGP